LEEISYKLKNLYTELSFRGQSVENLFLSLTIAPPEQFNEEVQRDALKNEGILGRDIFFETHIFEGF